MKSMGSGEMPSTVCAAWKGWNAVTNVGWTALMYAAWNTLLELPYVDLYCKRKAIYSFYPLSPVHNIPSTLALTLPDRTFGGWLVMPAS